MSKMFATIFLSELIAECDGDTMLMAKAVHALSRALSAVLVS